jgi:hypothetical protein
MKKYLPLYLFFFSTNILLCQKVEYGFGIGAGSYIFNHKDKKRFEGDALQPTTSLSGGILGYINFRSDYNFQIRSNIHLTYKPISFSATFQDLSGTHITNSMTFNFFSADFSLLGLYKVNLRKTTLLPFLGIYYSMNKFIDVSFNERRRSFSWSYSNNVSSGTQIGTSNFIPLDESKSNNVGINAGCFWHFKRFIKSDFFLMAYLSPTNFFDGNFKYKSLNEEKYLQGNYNYFILGMNRKISTHKKIAE